MQNKPLSFNELPEAISEIIIRLDRIEANQQVVPSQPPDQLMTVAQAATFLTLAKPTIYAMIGHGKIPYLKRGKRVYFQKNDLLDYLKAGRHKSFQELKDEGRLK